MEQINGALRARRRVQKVFTKPSRTKQAFRKECDINEILKKYKTTGQLPDLIKANPSYGDFADVATYQDSLNMVIFAQEQFAALPAKVRDRFANDPARFLEFAEDPANASELVKMGLATERQPSGAGEGGKGPKEEPRASKKVPKGGSGGDPAAGSPAAGEGPDA